MPTIFEALNGGDLWEYYTIISKHGSSYISLLLVRRRQTVDYLEECSCFLVFVGHSLERSLLLQRFRFLEAPVLSFQPPDTPTFWSMRTQETSAISIYPFPLRSVIACFSLVPNCIDRSNEDVVGSVVTYGEFYCVQEDYDGLNSVSCSGRLKGS